MRSPVKFNPFDPEFHYDPYPTYQALREQDPVSWTYWGAWVLTRHREVKAVLNDPRFNSLEVNKTLEKKNRYLQSKPDNLDSLVQSTRQFLFFLNPPDHGKFRRLALKAFPAKIWRQAEPFIEKRANELIDRVQHKETMDIMGDFAAKLSGQVIHYLLGLPETDWEQLHQWSMGLARILDPMLPLKVSQAMNRITIPFATYLQKHITQRRRQPTPDLLSRLLAVEENGESLTDDEVISLCMMFFIAGEHTTLSMIGTGTLALINYPDQLTLLQEKPKLISLAVEEMLRYESSIQLVAREAKEPVTLNGKEITAGQNLILSLAAANRDPEVFPEPDRFNILRKENRHVAFSGGTHNCIGAGLTRLEVPIAFNVLLQRLSELKLATDRLVWHESIVLRSLESLPITFKPR